MMTKLCSNKIFIVLLLLAFTGQSFAALMMPCQFGSRMPKHMNMGDMAGMGHPAMNHADMAGMGHSGMSAADPANPVEPKDCCKTMGHCSASSCSLIFLGHSFNIFLLSTQTDVNLFYARVFPEILASKLFRPPILG